MFRSSLFVLSLVAALPSVFGQKQQQPKLVVGIVVDQMCYDYLFRFYDQFGTDGFRRLMDKGSHFRNVTYNYVPTYTGPGHASVYTGTTPANHGIVANEWYHRAYGKEVNCVEDTTILPVGTTSEYGLCSPHFLRANTVTDQLKLTYPKGKVISVSIKDRSAILPGGHLSDGSYWYDYSTGNFITSSFYKNEMPQWTMDFRQSHPIGDYLKPWNLLYDPGKYNYYDLDNSPYEQLLGDKTAPVFPYDFTALPMEKQLGYLAYLPHANTYLVDFATSALKSEQLGKDSEVDMLTISFSTPDYVGHAFGPYSLEMEDMYLRLDQEIARLLAALDKEAGKGGYVVFLTADHAVVPVPQYLTDKQLPGGYVFLDTLTAGLRTASIAEFQTDIIDRIENDNVYLKEIYANSELLPQFTAFVRDEVLKWDGVKSVYTKEQLMTGNSTDIWMEMVRKGFDRERSGEVLFLLQPGYLPKSEDNETARRGTSHGSSFNYDTHVPVLFYGAGIPAQEVFTPYQITDIAASVVHLLQVQSPNAMTGVPMIELIKKK
jgi:predicted AlkP superfamily pyrophosphatase or phosphodiesterase